MVEAVAVGDHHKYPLHVLQLGSGQQRPLHPPIQALVLPVAGHHHIPKHGLVDLVPACAVPTIRLLRERFTTTKRPGPCVAAGASCALWFQVDYDRRELQVN